MKLLYAFFDYPTKPDGKGDVFDHHVRGKCELNFSTTHDYFIKKETTKRRQKQQTVYYICRKRKKLEECIPPDFWGNRVYNISAIIGENGSGKTTLIHTLIKAVISRYALHIPFLLVLQQTDSDDLLMYCDSINRDNYRQAFNYSGNVVISDSYPEQLKKSKIMLIDNTLSVSSEELVLYVLNTQRGVQSLSQLNYDEGYLQFYNKSLYASILHSSSISFAGRKHTDVSTFESLNAHFQYETFQEIRVLFDKATWNLINEMTDNGFNIPAPRFLHVSVESADSLRSAYFADNCGWDEEFPIDYNGREPFISAFCKDILISAYYSFQHHIEEFQSNNRAESLKELDESFSNLLLQNRFNRQKPIGVSEIQNVLLQLQLQRKVENKLEQHEIQPYRELLHFIKTNQDAIEEIFELVDYRNRGQYQVDIQKTIADDRLRNCFMELLIKYRAISDRLYFMSFSAGLSSGEKNILRVLTHLRYLLVSPTQFGDPHHLEERGVKGNTINVLRNIGDDEDYICDTLFLFLDEADLTYHPEWQRRFVSVLAGLLPRLFKSPYQENVKSKEAADILGGCKDIQVILATHSPLMVGDFPKASTIFLKRDNNGFVTTDAGLQESSFGQNLYTILKNDFYMQDTIGEFAKCKINAAAKWCGEVRKAVKDDLPTNQRKRYRNNKRFQLEQEFPLHRATVNLLPPGLIRSKLDLELEICRELLGLPKQDAHSMTTTEDRRSLSERKRRLEQEIEGINLKLQSLGDSDEQDS